MTKIKKYIFGYGSLMSPKEISYTLGKEVDTIYPVHLRGWVRDWSVVCANNSVRRRYTLDSTGLMPEYVVALNVRLPLDGEKATNPNGVLFEVNDSDIDKMDKRERHYSRVEVNPYIDNPPEGIIYAYTGTAEHLYFNKPPEREVILPSCYLDVVINSSKELGSDFLTDYQVSTLRPKCEVYDCTLVENSTVTEPRTLVTELAK